MYSIKRLIISCIVFLLYVTTLSAQETFFYNETDKVSFDVYASDPDRDELRVFYEEPLNEKGEWKTTYGDAGVYNISIEVTDGDLSDFTDMILVVKRTEERPVVTLQRPSKNILDVNEGKNLKFSVKAQDLNQDVLQYEWFLDGQSVSTSQKITYKTLYTDAGNHSLKVQITDGIFTIEREWLVQVHDVDIEDAVLDAIPRLSTFQEGDVISFRLPDFRYYGLSYNFSAPLENNYWETNYDSAGIYNLTLSVWGRGYQETKEFQIILDNVDRPPQFEFMSPQVVHEGNTLTIRPNVYDPDGEAVELSIANKPDQASFDNGTLVWSPDFDTVHNTNVGTQLARQFHALSSVHTLTFIARNNNVTVHQSVPVIIYNSNRAPTLDTVDELTVNEGELLQFDTAVSDPDNDPITFHYKNWIARDQFIDHDQAGTHYLTVIASDGFLEDEKIIKVIVNDRNRAPTLSPINDRTIKENETIRIPLAAMDADGDDVSLTLSLAPNDAAIVDNHFVWTPSFEATKKGFVGRYPMTVTAYDGTSVSKQNFTIFVEEVNRAPVVTQHPETVNAVVDQPVVLTVSALDFDGDNLSIVWDFGLFDKYEGPVHTRTFTRTGTKEGVVTVSDGKKALEFPFEVVVSETAVPVQTTQQVIQQQPVVQQQVVSQPVVQQQVQVIQQPVQQTQPAITVTQQEPEVVYEPVELPSLSLPSFSGFVQPNRPQLPQYEYVQSQDYDYLLNGNPHQYVIVTRTN